jgi:hypothetical protein
MKTSEREGAGLDSGKPQNAESWSGGCTASCPEPTSPVLQWLKPAWMSIKSHATPSFGSRASEES